MNLRIKRILSLLLVISIMFGMLVFPVSATETESAAEVVVEETTEPANEKAEKTKKEQITGIEPAFPAWEAGVLPMNHICM